MLQYKLYGIGIGIAAFAVLAVVAMADRGNLSANYTPTKATIARIERSCEFTAAVHRFGESIQDDCDKNGDFSRLRAEKGPRSTYLKGNATVYFSYESPVDHAFHTGYTTFDGKSDEFYALSRGDLLDIYVDKTDGKKIRGATPFGAWTVDRS